MNYTIRAVVRPQKMNAKGLCPIEICVTVNRARTYVSTGRRINPEDWDAVAGEVKPGTTNANLVNTAIRQAVARMDGKLLASAAGNDTAIDLRGAKKALAKGARTDFYKYATETLASIDYTQARSAGTLRRYTFDLATVKSFAGPVLSFEAITPTWLTEFHQHLLSAKQWNTATNALKFVRAMFNRARKEKKITLYPFAEWDFPAWREKPTVYLTLEECDSIRRQVVDNDLASMELRIVAAYFLLECYSGIRNSDWKKFQTERLSDTESLFLNTTKTGERIYIPIDSSPRLRQTIDTIRANKWSYTYTLEHTNRLLKLIGPLAGIAKRLRTHIGRHTCATLLLDKGYSLDTVAEVLGISLRVVTTYAKVTRVKVKREFERLGGL